MKHKARRYSLGTIFTTAYWSSVYSDGVSGVVVGDCCDGCVFVVNGHWWVVSARVWVVGG